MNVAVVFVLRLEDQGQVHTLVAGRRDWTETFVVPSFIPEIVNMLNVMEQKGNLKRVSTIIDADKHLCGFSVD